MRNSVRTIIVLALGVLGCAIAAQQGKLSITGSYVFSGHANSTLEIKKEAGHYLALLSGGSSEAAGAAASADCYIRAIGKLEGKTLVANFVPVETETFSYSEDQAKQEKRRLEIVFSPDGAEVTRADTFGYCGLGASFLGHYRRKTTE